MSKENPTRSETYAILFLVKRGILKLELTLSEKQKTINTPGGNRIV